MLIATQRQRPNGIVKLMPNAPLLAMGIKAYLPATAVAAVVEAVVEAVVAVAVEAVVEAAAAVAAADLVPVGRMAAVAVVVVVAASPELDLSFRSTKQKPLRIKGLLFGWKRRNCYNIPMNAREDAVLSVENLKVAFDTDLGQAEILRGLSYRLQKGKVLAVVGESGCGKTLHALSILKLLPPGGKITQGRILFKGKDILSLSAEKLRQLRGGKISMIFQDPMTSLNPIRTIGKQLTETILAHRKMSKLRAQAKAVSLLKQVGIANARERMKQYPFEFSGGQRQRIMIAMALCLHPEILIADEPTTALDVTIQAQILKLIKKLQCKNEMAAIFITHNLAIVADVADDVLVLYGGHCVEKAPVQALFASALHPYTQGLLGSLVSVNKKQEKLSAIEGYPPAAGQELSGCPFAPRCPRATQQCLAQLPPLQETNGHAVRCWHWEKNV